MTKIKALAAMLVAPAIIALSLVSSACSRPTQVNGPRIEVIRQDWCQCEMTIEITPTTVEIVDIEETN